MKNSFIPIIVITLSFITYIGFSQIKEVEVQCIHTIVTPLQEGPLEVIITPEQKKHVSKGGSPIGSIIHWEGITMAHDFTMD